MGTEKVYRVYKRILDPNGIIYNAAVVLRDDSDPYVQIVFEGKTLYVYIPGANHPTRYRAMVYLEQAIALVTGKIDNIFEFYEGAPEGRTRVFFTRSAQEFRDSEFTQRHGAYLARLTMEARNRLYDLQSEYWARVIWRKHDPDAPSITLLPYDRLICVDTALRDVPPRVLEYAIFHEMCRLCAYDFHKSEYLPWVAEFLILRHPYGESREKECQKHNIRFARSIDYDRSRPDHI